MDIVFGIRDLQAFGGGCSVDGDKATIDDGESRCSTFIEHREFALEYVRSVKASAEVLEPVLSWRFSFGDSRFEVESLCEVCCEPPFEDLEPDSNLHSRPNF